MTGVDVARGLAVLGMLVAHVGPDDAARLPNGSSWLEAFDGRSAAGFALLAGVSAALLSGGEEPAAGPAMRYARVRVLARAAVLLPLGMVLAALGTPVVVILPAYAVMFAMLTVALAWRPRTLLAAAGAVLLVGPPLVLALRDHAPDGGPVAILWAQYYPPLVWIAYLLVGLAVGRVLRAPGTPARLLGWGLAAAVVGHTVNAVAMRTIPAGRTFWRALLTTEPHSSSGLEVLANLGVVVAVLAICLVVGERWPRAVTPVAATGALALTAYAGQVVAIAALGREVVFDPSAGVLLALAAVTLGVATAWRLTLGRGPLERLLHGVSTAAATAIVPESAAPASAPPGPGPAGSATPAR